MRLTDAPVWVEYFLFDYPYGSGFVGFGGGDLAVKTEYAGEPEGAHEVSDPT